MNLWGLALNFAGTVLVGGAGYWGLAAGFGGPIVWTSPWWGGLWLLGWGLLAVGFGLQWLAAACR